LITGLWTSDLDLLVRAAALHDESGRPFDAARARRDVAVVAASSGDQAGARKLARLASDVFQALEAEGALARLRSDLRAVGLRLRTGNAAARPAFGWECLTPTESTVVGLVGRGSPTRQSLLGSMYRGARWSPTWAACTRSRGSVPERIWARTAALLGAGQGVVVSALE